MIGGIVPIRNGISLDYCFQEAILSLVPLCKEVIACDSDSTDGTIDALQELAKAHSNIKIINWPWPEPVNRSYHWLTDWINFARQQLTQPYQVALDADEVLYEGSYNEIHDAAKAAKSLRCHRLNFWRDTKTLIPHGRTCSHLVERCGPSKYWMPSDEMHPEGEPEIRQHAVPSSVLIFHYGFLRRREAIFAKSRVMLKAYFDTYDQRLVEAQQHPEKPWQDFLPHDLPYGQYLGHHPQVAMKYLSALGFKA